MLEQIRKRLEHAKEKVVQDPWYVSTNVYIADVGELLDQLIATQKHLDAKERETADMIESLQAQLADYHHMSELVDGKMEENQRLRRINENLQAQLAESQRREKAAVEDKGTLIKHLRLSGWCNGCKNFAGLAGCQSGQIEKCTGKNDMYEWRGPQKDGKGETE